MGFFKYPYTNYEKINLDWILRKIKALEPAIPLVEQSAAIVEEVQETAQEAAAAAESAQQAVATVTALAEQANETAEEAKEIAQQAASATIADGSVGWVKLSTDVQQVIEGNVSRSTTAMNTANAANSEAESATETATGALSAASSAQTTALEAKTQAANAESKANNALSALTWKWLATLRNSAESVQIPTNAKEVLLEAFNFDLAPRYIQSTVFETGISLTLATAFNFSLGNNDLYCVLNNSGQIVFDPNQTHTGDLRLRVCYR